MVAKIATLVFGTIFLGLTAFVLNIDQLYFMSAVIICVPLVAYGLSRISLGSVSCTRSMPSRAHEGDSLRVDLELTNPGWLPRFFLTVQDAVPPWLQPTRPPNFLVPILWGKTSARLTYELTTLKRGPYLVGPVRMTTVDPLGIFRQVRRLRDKAELLVYPTPLDLSTTETVGASPFAASQTDRWSRLSDGTEFYSIRPYQPGDELRRVHWKSTARRGELAVIEFEESFASDLTLVIDLAQGTDIGRGKETTLEYAVKMAASLARHAIDRGASAEVVADGGRGRATATARQPDQLLEIFEVLARATDDGTRPISQVLQELASEINPGRALVIFTSALDQGLVPVVTDLVGRGVMPIVILLEGISFRARPDRDLERENYLDFSSALMAAGVFSYLVSKGADLSAVLGEVARGEY